MIRVQRTENRYPQFLLSIIYFFLKDCYYYLLYLIIHTTLQFALEKQLAHRAGWVHIFISLFATSSGSVRTPARYNGDCVWHNVAWCRLGLSTQTHTPLHKQLSPCPYSLLHCFKLGYYGTEGAPQVVVRELLVSISITC